MDLVPTFLPGTSKDELDTPAFIIDLDVMEENIRKMAAYFESRPVGVRPHMKHHKIPAIAHKQIAAGAIGVCCQKLGEAEVMVAAGIKDVLITYQVVGPIKIARLMGLRRQANVMVIADDARNVAELSEAALAFGVKLGVLVDVDTGQHRTGVEPGRPSMELAETVAATKGLELRGVCGYAGHIQAIPDPEERALRDRESMELLMSAVEAIRGAGLPVEIVSGGGTGTYKSFGNHPEVTEVQVGSYVFMDAQYRRAVTDFEVSGTVLSTVMSRPSANRAVLDGGMKAISTDQWPPVVTSVEGVEVNSASDEHMVVTLTSSDARQLRPGDKVQIIPGHNDTTVNLHSHLFGLRNDKLETVWEVSARGRIR
jgi:D-serine deaminase-like pyridoxal phosphate-dependent protein